MSPPLKKPNTAQSAPGLKQMAVLLESAGISLSSIQLEQLWAYHQILRQFDPELNLTRIHNFKNMVEKLYADSILPGKLAQLPSPLLDLGTGPGMPGIPLKIAFPDLEILLAESRQKRRDFLNTALDQLKLKGISVLPEGIMRSFERPVKGVITRAVEEIDATLERIGGCLSQDGLAIFMKGPKCDAEIEKALKKFSAEYRLAEDIHYFIPHTTHERRLVIFEHLVDSLGTRKAKAVERHSYRLIESEHNELFKDLKKLLSARGIKKEGRALVSGAKIVSEVLADFPEICEAWISGNEPPVPPPENAPRSLQWYRLASPLLRSLDVLGTNAPLLLVKTVKIDPWDASHGLPEGCSVLIPFQDPENVGAVIRSAAAFKADRVILLSESANPYHPKSIRASGGAVFRMSLLNGPSLQELPGDLNIIPLSAGGADIESYSFPPSFGLLPGLEGPGLPNGLDERAVAIPISPDVESLNAATATAIALYVWSRSTGKR